MSKCPNCNYTSDGDILYCPMCGAKIIKEEPVFTPPVEPISYNYVAHQKPNLAKKIVGMALSIEAFAVSIIAFFYVVMFGAIEGEAGFITAFIFGIINFPPAIIGLTMSNKNRELGDTSVFSRLGKIFGIISVILVSFTLFIGFLMLAADY